MDKKGTREQISPEQSEELRALEPVIEVIWKECRSNEGGKLGDPPKSLFILKCTEANWESCYCHKEIIASWEFNGSAYFVHNPVIDNPEKTLNGMYWDKGIITFCLDKENGQAILNYFLGPRYGRGYMYSISQETGYVLHPKNGVLKLIS